MAPTNYFGVALAPAYYNPEAVIVPVEAAVGEKGKESGFSYKFSVSYKPRENLTTYATVSTGFRTPVVNARAGSVSQYDPTDIVIPDGADSDDLTNYEIGIKGDLSRQQADSPHRGLLHRLEQHPGPGQPRVRHHPVRDQHRRGEEQGY